MNRIVTLTLAAALAATAASATSTVAAPVVKAPIAQAGTDIVNVGHRHRWRGRAAAAGVGAFAAGAIIGSALAQPRYEPAPRAYYADDFHAYCFSKYKSYDPYTRTYMGYDGYRRPCR